MNEHHSQEKTAAAALAKLRRLSAWPPLLLGENGRERDDLEEAIRAMIQPRDAFEEIWTAESAAVQWEVMGLRRQRAAIINACRKPALAKIFESIAPYEKNESLTRAEQADMFAQQYFADKDTRAKLRELLARFELDPDTTMHAHALLLRLPEIEAINRLIASLEKRRDALWQQIYARRERMAQQPAELPELQSGPVLPDGKMPQLEHPRLNGK